MKTFFATAAIATITIACDTDEAQYDFSDMADLEEYINDMMMCSLSGDYSYCEKWLVDADEDEDNVTDTIILMNLVKMQKSLHQTSPIKLSKKLQSADDWDRTNLYTCLGHSFDEPIGNTWFENYCYPDNEACELQGGVWIEEDYFSFCEAPALLNQLLTTKVAQRPQVSRFLASITGSFNIPQLEEIARPVQEGEEEGNELFESAANDVGQVIENWLPQLEQWEREQQERETEAFNQLANVVVDSVTVDGTSLRDMIGGPDNWFMSRKQRQAKNIRSVVMQETTAENVSISFEGPSEQELNEWLASIQLEAEAIGARLTEIGEEYGEQFEDLERDARHEVEDVMEEDGSLLINRIGDDVKAVSDTIDINWYALASKKPQAAAKSSKTGFYAGMTVGFMSVVAAAGAIAACNRKQVSKNEEPLL